MARTAALANTSARLVRPAPAMAAVDLASDPARIRALGTALLAREDMDWTDWERDFLEHMANRASEEPLSTRQREVLMELSEMSDLHTTFRGMPVPRLVRACWLARLELDDEADEAFVVRQHAEAPTSLRRRTLGRLVAIAVRLGVVERHCGYATA